ncbi:MAG TPA: type II CAAX endopeptidase family protein [Polyangiaceae bacterium]|jgi:CAAX protease family protein|nr:type II CAAX endopeptidase family protein [Polyangiaceae bacterium]
MGSQPRWKIVLGAVCIFAATLAIVIAASIVSKAVPAPQQLQNLVNALLCLGGMALAMRFLAERWLGIDRQALGTHLEPGAWRRWLVGTLLGIGMAASAFVIAMLAGAFDLSGGFDGTPWSLVVISAVAMAMHALFEEVAFRAGLVGVLKERFPPLVAIVVPAILFGAVHLKNPGATLLGAVNGAIVGIVFGLLYLAGRRPSLALVAGVHFGWNEALHRMGIPVSGLREAGAFMVAEPKQSIWSGFAFGLEASPATTIVLTAVIAVSYLQFKKTH